jgi:hypothetical protein
MIEDVWKSEKRGAPCGSSLLDLEASEVVSYVLSSPVAAPCSLITPFPVCPLPRH